MIVHVEFLSYSEDVGAQQVVATLLRLQDILVVELLVSFMQRNEPVRLLLGFVEPCRTHGEISVSALVDTLPFCVTTQCSAAVKALCV